jgi:16S rRNA (guanine(966)-N(2))-methyltransferase RsmD
VTLERDGGVDAPTGDPLVTAAAETPRAARAGRSARRSRCRPAQALLPSRAARYGRTPLPRRRTRPPPRRAAPGRAAAARLYRERGGAEHEAKRSAGGAVEQPGAPEDERRDRRQLEPEPDEEVERATARTRTLQRVRIIAGSRKGARIAAPKGETTRPTADRVREAAFNLIGPVEGASVLDLFAGSGAMGLEALSRGAARVVFVERDRAACRTIDANLAKLRLTGATVLCQDVALALRQERAAGRRYDLILCDPPYGELAALRPMLAELLPHVLAPDGLLVVESDARELPDLPLEQFMSRRYGKVRLTLYAHA